QSHNLGTRHQQIVSKPHGGTCVQFLTGHGKFQSYFHRFGLSTIDHCFCGHSPQTPLHLIFDCPLFADDRFVLTCKIGSFQRSDHSHLLSREILLNFLINVFQERITVVNRGTTFVNFFLKYCLNLFYNNVGNK
ncbi:hypothetical protein DERP_005597, partial [Dermatophagoides pteronyssinus]